MSYIEINNLSFSYPNINNAINNINIHINEGEKVAIIGPNGGGKTTLFMLMCGIKKAQFGQIIINNQEVKHNHFNPQVAYLFQSPDDQLFNATIFDDVAFGPINMRLSGKDIISNVNEALEKTGTTPLKSKSPFHLSGGEKRLAAIATILSMKPRVYILDEPTSNLDAKNRRNIIKLISEMPMTMLISSHDLEFLLEVCDRCIIIDEGKIIASGDIRELLSNDDLLKEHHLEKPHSLMHNLHVEHVH